MESDLNTAATGNRCRRFVAFAVFAVVVAATVGWSYRAPLAEYLIRRQFDQMGLGAIEIAVDRLDRDRLELADLRIGDDLQIPLIAAQYTLTGLLRRRLDSLIISGVRVSGVIDESGISFGRLDALLAETEDSSSSTSSGPVSLPAGQLRLDDIRIELKTPVGPLVAELNANAADSAAGHLEAAASLRANYPFGNLVAEISGAGQRDQLSGRVSIKADVSGEFADGIKIEAMSLSAEPKFAYDAGEFTLESDDCATLAVDSLDWPGIATLARGIEFCIRSVAGPIASLDRNGGGSIDFEIEPSNFSIALEDGIEIDGVTPRIRARARQSSDGDLSATLSTKEGRLSSRSIGVGVQGISLSASASPLSSFPSGRLEIDQLFDTSSPKRFEDFSVKARFEPNADALADTPSGAPEIADGDTIMAFDLNLQSASGDFAIGVSGHHDVEVGAGGANFELPSFRFCGPMFADAFPIVKGQLTEADGSIDSHGEVEWDQRGVRGRVRIAIHDLSLTTPLAQIEHVFAALDLRESGSPPNQLLSIGRIDFGLELTNGEVLFQIQPGGIVNLESAVWDFADGKLETSGQVDLSAPQQAITFKVTDLDLGTLLEMVDLDGLAGSGTLGGNLPLIRSADEIHIDGASLIATDEGGVIRYLPDAGAASVAASESQFDMLLTVFENFHYRKLVLAINGDAAGEVIVKIHIEGSNPDFENGQVVNFNLSVDSRLSDLVTSESFVYQIPLIVEERMEQITGAPVNTDPEPCVHDG